MSDTGLVLDWLGEDALRRVTEGTDGRRNPSPKSAAAVAEVLEEHGAGMVELAEELREAAE